MHVKLSELQGLTWAVATHIRIAFHGVRAWPQAVTQPARERILRCVVEDDGLGHL